MGKNTSFDGMLASRALELLWKAALVVAVISFLILIH